MSSDEKSNSSARPNTFNRARHDKKQAKLTWIDVKRAINAIKTK
jgi:hypothetical protein